jgi:hypothetical protein
VSQLGERQTREDTVNLTRVVDRYRQRMVEFCMGNHA